VHQQCFLVGQILQVSFHVGQHESFGLSDVMSLSMKLLCLAAQKLCALMLLCKKFVCLVWHKKTELLVLESGKLPDITKVCGSTEVGQV
jgi:hypothetical protein